MTTTISPPTKDDSMPNVVTSAGPTTSRGQVTSDDPHGSFAPASTSPPTSTVPTPKRAASAGSELSTGQCALEAQSSHVGADLPAPDANLQPAPMVESRPERQTTPPTRAGTDPILAPSAGSELSTGQRALEAQSSCAGADLSAPDARQAAAPIAQARPEHQTTPPTRTGASPMHTPSAGSELSIGHAIGDPHRRRAGADLPAPDAMPLATPKEGSRPERQTTPPTRTGASPMHTPSAGSELSTDQRVSDTQLCPVGADLPAPDAMWLSTPNAGSRPERQTTPPTKHASTPNSGPSAGSELSDDLLVHAANIVDDLERTRIAAENRLRALRQVYDLDERDAQYAEARGVVEALAKLEKHAVGHLQKSMRRHPYGPWVARTRGVGEKQAARLLGEIGDPYIRPEMTQKDGTVEPSRPRTVSELWAYCGLHVVPAGGDTGQVTFDAQVRSAGVAPSRARGQRANWNAEGRKRVWLIAQSCIKSGGPYRDVYDATRIKYADAVHDVPCRRCGPSGRPALPGSPLSAGHQHARAVRAMCKAIMRDLWLEGRALHEGTS